MIENTIVKFPADIRFQINFIIMNFIIIFICQKAYEIRHRSIFFKIKFFLSIINSEN